MSQCNTTANLRTFIVVRYGSNGANQPMTHRMVLGTVQAADSDAAKRIAGEQFSCYNNQHFEAIDTAGRTRQADRDAAAEEDAYRREAGVHHYGN